MGHHYRKSSWRHPDNLAKRKLYDDSYIRQSEDGLVHLTQRKYTGYGFTEGILVGTKQQIDDAVADIYRKYPPAGYGTMISWPPDPIKYKNRLQPSSGWSSLPIYAPYEQLGEDLWVLWYSHSESCE